MTAKAYGMTQSFSR